MEKGFVYIDEYLNDIYWDAKYATKDNFTGHVLNGYTVNRVVCREYVAEMLKSVQAKAAELNLKLLFWDGYRPMRAVKDMLYWAQSEEDFLTKEKHYPNIDKRDMVKLGYVAERSGHSRGSAIDLTLTDSCGNELDMGTCFDFMDEASHYLSTLVSEEAQKNRQILRRLMEDAGFRGISTEWWHFVPVNELDTDSYYDFIIE